MQKELEEILGKLMKPISLERSTGFKNTSCWGGFHRYITIWAEKGLELAKGVRKELFEKVIAAASKYVDSTPAQRERIMEEIEKLIEALRRGKKEQEIELSSPVQYLKGVGPKRAQLLARLGVETVGDLLYYFPRRHEDRRKITPIAQVAPGEKVTVRGRVVAKGVQKVRSGREDFRLAIEDPTGVAFAIWFNQPFRDAQFKVGDEVIVCGKGDIFLGERQIHVEEFEIVGGLEEDLLNVGRLVPVYSTTANLPQSALRGFVRRALDACGDKIGDFLPKRIREENNLAPLPWALEQIHFPQSEEAYSKARERLVFDEFFLLQLGLHMRRGEVGKEGIALSVRGELLEEFLQNLPFQLTNAQKEAIAMIRKDMESGKPMARLLQGDVGAGKTVVAIAGMLIACEGGYQSALMAPTEILTEQHYATLSRWVMRLGLRVELLIGSLPQGMKEEILQGLAEGDIDIVVGTHALIEERVRFRNLGLVVIDEQHKFGVMQRAELVAKGENPHLLVMTATPIPRSLALTLYGDLDVTLLDELPPGRQRIITLWFDERERGRVYEFVAGEVGAGRQAYIVYPVIEEGKLALKSACQMAIHFKEKVFPNFRVGLLHGRMGSEEKEEVMKAFRDGEIDILVATTVIEVGIDVPNATIMVIEHAERFGLAQLHQLRGRVGRGGEQSYCILLGEAKSEEARRRLEIMCATQDGFKIAEEDLHMRGPGEFLGKRQHGLPELRIGDIVGDMKLLQKAREAVRALLESDPELAREEHALIKMMLDRQMEGGRGIFS